jgi:anti-sigma factor RsiW
MLNERTAELIQADIDGELAERDRSELEAALEQSAEARQFRDEMVRVAQLLESAPDLDPPWGLRRRILDNIKLPSRPRLAAAMSSLWSGPVSYGLAMAAGMLIAIGFAEVAPQGQEDLPGLVGTMVTNGADLPGSAAGALQIDLAAVNGRVNLKPVEDQAWVLEFDLQSSQAVEVAVDLGSSGLTFGGFANQDSGVENFTVSGGDVRVINEGNHRFVLFLRDAPERGVAPQEIAIAVNIAGNTVFRGMLESRG